jgi:hypothetical protein
VKRRKSGSGLSSNPAHMAHVKTRWPDSLLPPCLKEALAVDPRPDAVKDLVAFCHTMATAYVRAKVARGTFQPSRIGMSPRDFALDAVADLFRMDRDNRLDLFRSLLPLCSEPVDPLALHHQIRRIVFGAVNQHIFRSFHLSDPALARLIRNIKETVATMKNCQSIRWQESLFIAPRVPDLLMDQPLFSEELLQIEFGNRASRSFSLREHLNCIAAILQEQSTYRRIYPLTGIALLVRSMLTDSRKEDVSISPWENAISESEVADSVDKVVEEISRTLFGSYRAAGKMEAWEIDAYKGALRDVLRMTYVHGDGNGTSFFTIFSKHLGHCGKHEYMESHRARFEYAVKLAKVALQKRWQVEIGFSAEAPDCNDR